jgi:adenylate cyclase
MKSERVERRLAAIVAADVAGYSRLMGSDEVGTLRRLKGHRRELVDPTISAYGGRIVKTTGDGILIEFASVVDAVGCTIAIQRGMVARNAEEPENKRIVFRVGINVGDIIIDGDDIFGDGVNVAARLEAICEPGGLCISRSANEQVRDKLSLAFADLGEQVMKNIERSVGVFGLGAAQIAAMTEPALSVEPVEEKVVRVAPAKDEAVLPPLPSIAVLPFANMSGDPDQEFFGDGLAEDILTGLSRFHDLFVISRNSTFRYKGKNLDIRTVARELGAQFILEGSVRRAGKMCRVSVQLIDAETDRHVWAERYDRGLEDIFAVQDEITSSVVAILPKRVEAVTRERAARKAPTNLAAYDCVLAAKLLHHRSTIDDNAEAQRLIGRAIGLDDNYAHAHAWRACILGQSFMRGWADPKTTGEEIVRELKIALALDDNDSDVHRILAAVNLAIHKDHDKSFYHQERALSLNPNDDLIVVQQGEILTWLGRADEGIDWIKKAMRLNPYHPERFWGHLGRAYFVARRYGDAIAAYQRMTTIDATVYAMLAGCHAASGEQPSAQARAADVIRVAPEFGVEQHLKSQPYKHASDREHHRSALLTAGLPL